MNERLVAIEMKLMEMEAKVQDLNEVIIHK